MPTTPTKSPFSARETERILARRKKWTDALRSGKFKQGHRALHWEVRGTYCCLGVADVVCNLKNECGGVLDFRNLLKLGLSESQQGFLASKNDKGYDFKFIANEIDKMPIKKEGAL